MSVVVFTGKEATFVECSGKVDVLGTVVLSTLVYVESSGDGVLWVRCECKGVQKESSGSCDWLSPGESVVICPLLFHPPGPCLASGDPMRPRM